MSQPIVARALVAHAIDRISVESITLDAPRAGEVLVRMAATGVCRSDLSVIHGMLPLPLPLVLGHEGAGVVEAVGDGVTRVEVGDHVVLSFVPACGECFYCGAGQKNLCSLGSPDGRMLDGSARAKLDGRDIGVMQFLGALCEYAVVPAACAVRIDRDLPLDKAALVGCAVMTGVGAAINTAKVPPGCNVAVFGCGGIGLSIVQGARIAGASRIIAVDVSADKRAAALQLGATHVLDPSVVEPVGEVRRLTGDIGADFTFEAAGSAVVIMQALSAARRGGTATVVGLAPISEQVTLNALLMAGEAKTIKGSVYGDANPHVDFDRLLRLYRRGRLNLDDMVTRTYTIEEAAQAVADLERGANLRGVVVFDR